MSALRNVLKKNSGRIDGTVAVIVVGSAIVFSSIGLANATPQDSPAEPTQNVVVSGSAGNTVTVSGSAGITLP